ncbi:MAG: lactate utilization protein C [Nocardioidaceae bacterium]|nr:lactate utilization protein C [Nocardioidaceae bacterium]MCL2611754.1 lactate utilization protein C [Nocardioidaceae bacterium]
MSGREEVLARVRAALADATPTPAPAHVRAPSPVADVADLFVERVEDYRAEVRRTAAADLPAAVADALAGVATVVVPDGVDAAWTSALGPGVARPDDGLDAAALDQVGAVLTGAAVGIAVTGTIVLDHGPDQGRRALSLVPDIHVCVVRASQLVADVPDAVDVLAVAVGGGRPLTWISGPSATSDIELERVEGVHGPRTLRVILVADA